LRRVDNGCAHHGPEDTSIADGKGATRHVIRGDFAFFAFVTQVDKPLQNRVTGLPSRCQRMI
jgi:hypothetical protein